MSSRTAQKDESIKFIVKQNVIFDEEIVIARGAIAWGKIVEAQPAGLFGIKGKLVISIDKVQAVTGEWFSMKLENGKNSFDVESDRDLFAKIVPMPLIYIMAGGAQPSIPPGVTIVGTIDLSRKSE